MTSFPAFTRASLLAWVAAAMLWSAPASAQEVQWDDWSEAVFARARQENKLVLLDLEAVWCHWCHVMDETTYRDPEVQALLSQRYLAVKVDQDARPDLSNRYRDYGWPATVLFAPDGTELVKLDGYRSPEKMRAILKRFADNPVPEESAAEGADSGPASAAALPEPLRGELYELLVERYDHERGGWGRLHKFLNWETGEYCLARAAAKDAQLAAMIRTTLDRQKQLVDPVWGGVYQYSHGGTWDHPHFEKIMQVQAENLRLYSQAYQLWGEPEDLAVARGVRRYLNAFLRSPEGAYYTSQDADLVQGEHAAEYFALSDAERRRRGVPRVDTHRYARENGWVIQGLAVLYGATGDEAVLADAVKAADWVIGERSLGDGGFRHDARDAAGPYLGDSLAMGRAFLALYTATAERRWLDRAVAAADFVDKNFALPGGGYATAVPRGSFDKPWLQREEVVGAARFFNLLCRYTGEARFRAAAERAMAYLVRPAVAREFSPAGVLLASEELASEPSHLTVVGRKGDPAARALYLAALRFPLAYRRLEWQEPGAPPLPNTGAAFPDLGKSAIFVCSGTRCSPPMFLPEEVARLFPRPARPRKESETGG